jgi:hypothetical protein
MKKLFFILFILCGIITSAQNTNTQSRPYIETYATADSLVVPDRIYMTIRLDEKDSKGRISVEQLEKKMQSALENANIDLKKQLSLNNLGSDFSKYFLRKKDVSKEKIYELLLYDAKSLSKVLINLEKVKISNVRLKKVEYSKAEELQLILRQKAVLKTLIQAQNLVKPLKQEVGNAILINDIQTINRFYTKNHQLDGLGVIRSKYQSKTLDQIEFKKIKITASVQVRFHLY